MTTVSYRMKRSSPGAELGAVARLLYWLMLRNMSSEGITYSDPNPPNGSSLPGCIVASPSYSTDEISKTSQDYVYNWTRDAAMVAIELARFGPTAGDTARASRLNDYVSFADTCQKSSRADLSYAAYTIAGQPREPWPHQNDGPALQTIAILNAFEMLDEETQDTARNVMQKNVEFILSQYAQPSYNLWEEVKGQSFFTRAVQLQCLDQLAGNSVGIDVPPSSDEVRTWLRKAMDEH